MKKVFIVLTLLALMLTLTAIGAGADGETVDGETAEAGSTTFSEEVAALVTGHLPEILSALTLVGTGLLVWLFKKSVLPILERGLGRIGGGVDSLSKEAKAILESARAETQRLAAGAEALRAAAKTDAARVALLEGELSALRARSESERNELRSLVQSSLAMMKEVFTAARLPASSKLALEEIYRSASGSHADVSDKG